MTAQTAPSRRTAFLADSRGWFRAEGLVRSRDGRWVGGVCRGIAARYGVDPLLVRLGLIVSFLLPGPQVIAYAALWVLMPQEAPRSSLTASA